MTDDDEVLSRRDGRVLRLTINRPERHNPLSRPVLARLAVEMTRAAADDELACVVIRGAGRRYFAAGGDLRDLDEVREPEATREMALAARAALDTVRQCPVPVVAMVNGDAIGGGGELAVACDFRVMRAGAHIGYIHGRLNISSAWGGGTDLCTLIGASRALRMMARSELVPAATALAWGLADEVADDDEAALEAAVDAFIAPMLRQRPQVIRAATAQARARRNGEPSAARRELELQHIVATWSHADHLAAVDRFFGRSGGG